MLALAIVSLLPAISDAQEDKDFIDEEEGDAEDYVEEGTIEIGGSIGAGLQDDVWTITASPTVGYFVWDRVELSAILNLSYVRDTDMDTTTKSGALLVEPSYHYPVSDDLLVLLGFGVGPGYNGDDWDFEIVPRVGLNVLTKGSSVITPSVRMPIRIGEAFGTSDGDVGTDVGILFDVGVTTTW
jgi:hypothetical protein